MKTVILDKYEQELEDSLTKGEFKSVKNLEESKKFFEEAAKNYIELHKTKRITLRVNQEDLIKVKVKAKEHSIPYQRLISTLIHQYAKGAMKIVI